MLIKCSICGQMAQKAESTPLKGLGGTFDGWECPECDEAARNAQKIETEGARGFPMERREPRL